MRKADVLGSIVWQHADEVGFLWTLRDAATRAFDYDLREIDRLDDRVDAHLDGLRCAGVAGQQVCERALAAGRPGDLFAPTVLALEIRDAAALRRLIALGEATSVPQRSLLAAFGWVSPRFLSGVVAPLLASDSAFDRQLALAGCSFHRVSPGQALVSAVNDENDAVRARALRTVGEIGATSLTRAVVSVAERENGVDSFWAAWSAVLLGNRQQALDHLTEVSLTSGPHRWRALQMAILAQTPERRRALLKRCAARSDDPKLLILATGISGDSYYVPWLIAQMKGVQTSRTAGLALSMITGVDLRVERLDVVAAPVPEDEPAEAPSQIDDEHLPVPDWHKVSAWWNETSQRFPEGVPHLDGGPVTPDHCVAVLKKGAQLQRSLAAQYLCLLNPGTSLFNISAPAWRQHKLLALL